MQYTSSILQVYFWSILKVHLKFSWSILQIYFNNKNCKGRSILQVYIISTKKVYLNIFSVYIPYCRSILKVYFQNRLKVYLCIYFGKYVHGQSILQVYFECILQTYFCRNFEKLFTSRKAYLNYTSNAYFKCTLVDTWKEYLFERKYTSSILSCILTMYTVNNTSVDILKNDMLEGKYTKYTLNVYFKYISTEIGNIYTSGELDFKYTLNVYFKYTFLIHSKVWLISKSILESYFNPTSTLWLYVISMSCMRFRVTVKKLFVWNRHNICNLGDRTRIQTHSHLIRTHTLKHLAKLATWLSICLKTKWL